VVAIQLDEGREAFLDQLARAEGALPADVARRVLEEYLDSIPSDARPIDERGTREMTFEAYLKQMPEVGTDADLSRIEGAMGDVDLSK
jgi:hypothetical protein